jgi:hypothetical protein
MTELDRIFRHFFARDTINQSAAKGEREDWLLLDPTDGWVQKNFKPGTYKDNRRRLFFPDRPGDVKSWSAAANGDPNPFADEDERAAQTRADRNQKAKARRDAPANTTSKKQGAGAQANAKRNGTARGKPSTKADA